MGRLAGFLAKELREAFVPFVCFAALFSLGQATRALLLEEYHITTGSTLAALLGALIVAKAILVAEALPVTRRYAGNPLVYAIALKVAIYWMITFAFRYVEELWPYASRYGMAEGHTRLLAEVSWWHVGLVQLWVLFALVLYCTIAEFVAAIGPGKVRALLFGGRQTGP